MPKFVFVFTVGDERYLIEIVRASAYHYPDAPDTAAVARAINYATNHLVGYGSNNTLQYNGVGYGGDMSLPSKIDPSALKPTQGFPYPHANSIILSIVDAVEFGQHAAIASAIRIRGTKIGTTVSLSIKRKDHFYDTAESSTIELTTSGEDNTFPGLQYGEFAYASPWHIVEPDFGGARRLELSDPMSLHQTKEWVYGAYYDLFGGNGVKQPTGVAAAGYADGLKMSGSIDFEFGTANGQSVLMPIYQLFSKYAGDFTVRVRPAGGDWTPYAQFAVKKLPLTIAISGTRPYNGGTSTSGITAAVTAGSTPLSINAGSYYNRVYVRAQAFPGTQNPVFDYDVITITWKQTPSAAPGVYSDLAEVQVLNFAGEDVTSNYDIVQTGGYEITA